MKAGDKIVMAPSGVQKERMEPDDMFVLDAQGNVLHTPVTRPPPYKPPKLSECAPLFTAVSNCSWHQLWFGAHVHGADRLSQTQQRQSPVAQHVLTTACCIWVCNSLSCCQPTYNAQQLCLELCTGSICLQAGKSLC